MKGKAKTVLPAVGMTAVSMVLTLAVVVMWLGTAMPWPVAVVVGLGIDGGWLATLAYERRLAAQGDHSTPVTVVGWSFGLVATGVLIAHALTAEESAGAWLAVAWLPIAAKALWLVHGLWERTALTGEALDAIQGIQQEARDEAAVARARLRAEAATEETRLTAVTQAGARVARVQARTAAALSGAWSTLEEARQGDGTSRALESVAAPAPDAAPRWELPVWGPVTSLTRVDSEVAPEDRPELAPASASPQLAAAVHLVSTPADTGREVDDEEDSPADRLPTIEAQNRIRVSWVMGHSLSEAARLSTRSRSYCQKVYARLDAQKSGEAA
ncbi:protein spdB [Streptomyces sp. JAC18]|uniref:protein spdB n=1 Tax=Streptomyces sp. JAC18 TaxID=3418414 RepID=UPI003D815CD3